MSIARLKYTNASEKKVNTVLTREAQNNKCKDESVEE